MRIAKIEDLHCDAGWRTWSFLKITTDDGVVGWSEYNESYGSRGLTAVIQKLANPTTFTPTSARSSAGTATRAAG